MKTSGGDLFTDKVKVNLDMFHPSVENGISREIGGTDVVAPQRRRGQRNVKLAEEGGDPEEFRCGVSNRFVFHFSARASDSGIFLGAPRNKIVTEVNKKSTCRSTIKRITSPVGIAEGCEKHRRGMTKLKPMSDGAFEVSEKMLQASPISGLRRVH